jgi:N-acetyl-gamma-glutamyl-phosphate reductase
MTIHRAAILGASGYTGAEMIRLALAHPRLEIAALTGHSRAGQAVAATYPHFMPHDLPDIVKISDVDWSDIDVAFACLPHGASQDTIADISEKVSVIIDLSADFRLKDKTVYAQTYKRPHDHEALLSKAVYGLTEYARDDLKDATLIACPGCYPTASLLALAPALEQGLIDPDNIIIDAKSGVTGAGRKAVTNLIFPEVSDGAHAYSVGVHRHAPEIDQFIKSATNKAVKVRFTPHLIPMNRGMIATCYVDLTHGSTAGDLRAAYLSRYKRESFITVLPEGQAPQTRHVRGSNHVQIGIFADRIAGKAIIISVIDNLMKGSAGQAVQNYNVTQGWNESLGLKMDPLFP